MAKNDNRPNTRPVSPDEGQREVRTIFIVVRAVGYQDPIVAFTQKDELTKWLKGRTAYDNPVRIYTVQDGREVNVTAWYPAEHFTARVE